KAPPRGASKPLTGGAWARRLACTISPTRIKAQPLLHLAMAASPESLPPLATPWRGSGRCGTSPHPLKEIGRTAGKLELFGAISPVGTTRKVSLNPCILRTKNFRSLSPTENLFEQAKTSEVCGSLTQAGKDFASLTAVKILTTAS